MFYDGDYVVYKRDVCKIKEIKKNFFAGKDYYIMHPITDESLIINVPTENKLGLLRSVISKKEAENLIDIIPNIEINYSNDRMIENEYRVLMNSNKLEDIIKVIKMTYLRNDERVKSGKKISEKDDIYFKKAEDVLYNELSISLGMTYDEVKKYIIDKVSEADKLKNVG